MKKAICAVAALSWAVIALVFIYGKAREQAEPVVICVQPQWDEETGQVGYLPGDAIFHDEDGDYLLTVYQGTGKEAGARVQRVTGEFKVEGDRLALPYGGFGEYVRYASRELREGELVRVIQDGGGKGDRWLAVLPDGFEQSALSGLPENIIIEEQSGSAVQLVAGNAPTPFVEDAAKSALPMLEGARVYSFADMNMLLDNLPGIGRLLGVLIAAVILWVSTCFLTKYMDKYGLCVWINLGLWVLLLVYLPFVIREINLPVSLLPKGNIMDIGYYLNEFDEFFRGLKSFAPPASDIGVLEANLPESIAGQEIIFYKNMTIGKPVYYMILGMVLPGALVIVERAVVYVRHMPRLT
mgnify:CR=1 FL=1